MKNAALVLSGGGARGCAQFKRIRYLFIAFHFVSTELNKYSPDPTSMLV